MCTLKHRTPPKKQLEFLAQLGAWIINHYFITLSFVDLQIKAGIERSCKSLKFVTVLNWYDVVYSLCCLQGTQRAELEKKLADQVCLAGCCVFSV